MPAPPAEEAEEEGEQAAAEGDVTTVSEGVGRRRRHREAEAQDLASLRHPLAEQQEEEEEEEETEDMGEEGSATTGNHREGGKSKARLRMEQINRSKAPSKGGKKSSASRPSSSLARMGDSVTPERPSTQENERSCLDCSSLAKEDGGDDAETKGPSSSSARFRTSELFWKHDDFSPIETAETVEYCPACGLPPDFCEFGEKWQTQCKPWVLTHHPEYYPELTRNTSSSASPSAASHGHSDGHGDTSSLCSSANKSRSAEPLIDTSTSAHNDAAVTEIQAGMSAICLQAPSNRCMDKNDSNSQRATASQKAPACGRDPTSLLDAGEDAKAPDVKKKGSKKGVEKPACVTIQKVSRAKKKTVTVVIGLDTLGVKLGDAAKLFSKKFSCGASVVKGGSGLPDQIDIQGDVADALEDVITTNFPEVSGEKITHLKSK